MSSDSTNFPTDHWIIDIGMNDGKDTEYYAKRGFKVVSFEANPVLVEAARSKFQNRYPQIEIRNLAISDDQGELTFYVNKFNSAWSSLDEVLGARRDGAEQIKVASCNLVNELAALSELIHYVKIDIEGFDHIALRQILKLPHLPQYVSVENGSEAMLKDLRSSGYSGFKFSNQRYVPAQSVPEASPHGKIIEHDFLISSSGVFGEDLVGRWLTYEEAIAVNEGLSYGRKKAPNNLWADSVGWFDLHAKLG